MDDNLTAGQNMDVANNTMCVINKGKVFLPYTPQKKSMPFGLLAILINNHMKT